MFKKITGLENKHPIRLIEMTMCLAKGIHLIGAIYAVECFGEGGGGWNVPTDTFDHKIIGFW